MPGMTPGNEQNASQAALRSLPSVDHLLNQPAVANLLAEYPRVELVQAVRAVLEGQRKAIRNGHAPTPDTTSLALAIRQELYQRSLPHLRRVVNATGIVLHTGLGRAPLAAEAVEAVAEVAAGYCNLELNLETGRRGDRHDHARDLLRELTGAEDALVVNNNAAGTYLSLNTLAAEREVVVSRGQLVEIGGSYRMPDIMDAARCRMVEVGTTNRTKIADYERVIGDETAALLKVHTSNYRIQGFVASPTLEDLVALAHKHNLIVIDDLGSGLLDERFVHPMNGEEQRDPSPKRERGSSADNDFAADTATSPAWDEPSVRHSVTAGADLTLFSGDKLLGGPQAGVIIGRADLIERLRSNPLARTFRPDKLTLAGIEATLRLYRDPQTLHRRLPVFRMLTLPPDELEASAHTLAEEIKRLLPAADIHCAEAESLAGGGALPLTPFQTWVVTLRHPELRSADLAAALRNRTVPIICRLHGEALLFDCRTLSGDDPEHICGALAEVARDLPSE